MSKAFFEFILFPYAFVGGLVTEFGLQISRQFHILEHFFQVGSKLPTTERLQR